MARISSEKTVGMRLDLPVSWRKKLKIMAALSGIPQGGAKTEVMKAIAAWIKEKPPPDLAKRIRKSK